MKTIKLDDMDFNKLENIVGSGTRIAIVKDDEDNTILIEKRGTSMIKVTQFLKDKIKTKFYNKKGVQ